MELAALMQDTEFSTAIEQATNAEEVAELLRNKGFDVDPTEVEKVFSTESHEMDEQELETVTGGGLLSTVWSYIKALRYSAGGGGFSKGGGGNGSFGGNGVAGGSR